MKFPDINQSRILSTDSLIWNRKLKHILGRSEQPYHLNWFSHLTASNHYSEAGSSSYLYQWMLSWQKQQYLCYGNPDFVLHCDCIHGSKESYFAGIAGATQVEYLLENFVFRKITALFFPLAGHGTRKFRNPLFRQTLRHHRAATDGRNRKMNRGQETHPIRLNVRYQMKSK